MNELNDLALTLLKMAYAHSTATDVILNLAIREARTAGYSWEAIGEAMGMSRQMAHKRFGAAVDEPNHTTHKHGQNEG
jgi:hypothetical protein